MNSKIKYHELVNQPRRRFLRTCAACGVCMALAPATVISESCTTRKRSQMKIRIFYSLHELVQARPDWPNIGFNFEPVIENINDILRREFPSFEFISSLATGEEDALEILQGDKNEFVDGYIVYQMNCWNRVIQTIAKSLKPVLYVDFQYGGSGGFLVYNSGFLSKGQNNLGFVSSSRMEDLIEAVKCFDIVGRGGTNEEFVAATIDARLKATPKAGDLSCKNDPLTTLAVGDCHQRMKDSRILAVRDQNSGAAGEVMEIPLEYVSFSEVNDEWKRADQEKSKFIAEKWKTNALAIEDVEFAELQNSAAMYLAMKAVLANHNANAITINCLGGFYGGHIHAYPCLGFHQLNNDGLIGACECDISSTATMVAFTTITGGRPGFISDPVIDTSKRQIIYAHCVAPNKMFGPDGPENPYIIMNHSEDRQGAAVRSKLPLGFMTTTLRINNDRKEIIFHQGKTVENDPDDRACRTKLCAEPVGDVEKLFTQWEKWGWHRVTFYGDLKKPVYELADHLGWNVAEEA